MAQTCQSCGMPVDNLADFGTYESGAKKLDYCRFCFEKGRFTEPDLTLEGMIEKISTIIAEKRRMPLEEAKKAAGEMLAKLKRWRTPPGA